MAWKDVHSFLTNTSTTDLKVVELLRFVSVKNKSVQNWDKKVNMDGPQSETIDARKEGFITRVRMNTGSVTDLINL